MSAENSSARNRLISRLLTAEQREQIFQKRIEIASTILLALATIATAWSGYQAAKWDGRQAELYGEASTIRIRADQLLTLGGQQRLLDVSTFNTWIEARSEGRSAPSAPLRTSAASSPPPKATPADPKRSSVGTGRSP